MDQIWDRIIITNQSFKFMYMQRQNIDLESILDKGSALSRPRAPTPIRKVPVRVGGNKENMINPTNQWTVGPLKNNNNFEDKQLMQNNHKKPLISPVRHQFKTQIDIMQEQQKRNNRGMFNNKQRQSVGMTPTCANHANKNAQFNIDIEDQCFAYCSRCAAQLASQGFAVRKIQAQTVKKGMPSQIRQMGRQLPVYPEYEGNPMYELILQFLTQLSEVENEHLQNMTKLTTIDENYNEQIEHTKYFYTQLLSFVQQMRDDHINDLVEQSRRHSQIADIQHDYLRQNVDEINNIRKDIEENLETIVDKLDEEDLKNNLNYYRQKLQVYMHKVEEQADFFTKLISFTPEQYQSKQARVQDFLMEVWNSNAEPTQSQQSDQPQPQRQSQERFVQKLTPSQVIMEPQSQYRRSVGPTRQTQNATKIHNQYQYQVPSQPQPQPQSARLHTQPQPQSQMPAVVANLGKKPSNQVQQEAENKSTAFRKLFEEDEEQVMAETSPQFKKI